MFTKHETGNVLAFPHFGKEKDTMKLLIVDDEKLTREGIRDSIARLSLPFDSILLADDGVHGLETAVSEQPDIVLTDVRMPRITGVEMAEA